MKKRVIIVTDGDEVAKKAVEVAAGNIGGRAISRSAGNPSPLNGQELIGYIKKSTWDPVIVMVDDCGDLGNGEGEKIIREIYEHPDLDLLGVVAVASNTVEEEGVRVDRSVTRQGTITERAVDKHGDEKHDKVVRGDTVSILSELKIPVIIGLGDPGKMDFSDRPEDGAPLTTRALQEIINQNGRSRLN